MTSKHRRAIEQKRGFSSPEEEALLNLFRTAGVLNDETEAFFRAAKLTGPLFNVLRILEEDDPEATPSQQIGPRLLARAPDVTRLVDRLVDRGLALRARSDADRRVVYVKITQKGRRLLSRVTPGLEDLHEELLGHMSRKDLEQLSRLLLKARKPEQSL